MKENDLRILPAITWVIIVTVLLCLPGAALPRENWFDKIWLDKWIHIALFLMMVYLWCRYISKSGGKKIRYFSQIAIYFFVYGIVMELVQKYFIPNRSFDLKDILADGLGCAMGLLISNRSIKK
ncbi:MAG TPA: VanZ family protein [Chitinophagaceae bacterium]|nr:VanZ family protein [Chitinophagaceae bacterium]